MLSSTPLHLFHSCVNKSLLITRSNQAADFHDLQLSMDPRASDRRQQQERRQTHHQALKTPEVTWGRRGGGQTSVPPPAVVVAPSDAS